MVNPACWTSVITLSVTRYHWGRSQIAAKLNAAQLKDVVYRSRTVTRQAALLSALHRGGDVLQSAWGNDPPRRQSIRLPP
jgi:hypothetical protein